MLFSSSLSIAIASKVAKPDDLNQNIKALESRIESLEKNKGISDSNNLITRNYTDILEKTNSQLSLWTNPYGLMVGALSFLLTALAIAVAFVLYKQSLDHKNQLEEERAERKSEFLDFLTNSRNVMKQLIEENISKTTKELDLLIEQQKKLTISASVEEINKINNKIAELEKQKANVSANVAQAVAVEWENSTMSALAGLSTTRVHKCKSCGFGFKIKAGNPLLTLSNGHGNVTCPKCKNVDEV
jgi:rubrerythrin